MPKEKRNGVERCINNVTKQSPSYLVIQMGGGKQTPCLESFLQLIHAKAVQTMQPSVICFPTVFSFGDTDGGWKMQPHYYKTTSFLLNPRVVWSLHFEFSLIELLLCHHPVSRNCCCLATVKYLSSVPPLNMATFCGQSMCYVQG